MYFLLCVHILHIVVCNLNKSEPFKNDLTHPFQESIYQGILMKKNIQLFQQQMTESS